MKDAVYHVLFGEASRNAGGPRTTYRTHPVQETKDMATPEQIAALIKAAAYSDQNVIDAVSKWVASQINQQANPPKREVQLRANVLPPAAHDSSEPGYRLPEDGLIRYQELKENIIPVSRATLWKWMRDGKFPQTVKIGGHYVAWRSKDIREWLDSLSPSDRVS